MTQTTLPPMAAPTADQTGIEIPTHWRNLAADFPHFSETKLPDAIKDSTPDEYAYLPKMPLSLGRQSFDTVNPLIAIPEPVREMYALYRPTPLRRAERFERDLGVDAHIYYKFEGANISGSHKLNSALAQAYYFKQAGVKHIVTGTGAGQWGTAIAFACAHFGLKCTVFMPRVSLEQKPQRRVMMEMFGAELHASPSEKTEVGRRARAERPDRLGTLAIATGEALEMTRHGDRTQFAVGSGENHVLLHQTVIGQEALEQMRATGEYPDLIFACMGAGSNFAGIAFPFLGDEKAPKKVRAIAVEPAACPKMTRGVYAYTETDFSGSTPIARMMTLGAKFEAPGIHAGGLRYHGTSPFLSALFAEDYFGAEAYAQREVFASAARFARTEGVLAAPESAHAIRAAEEHALAAQKKGEAPVILINISGMGYYDMAGFSEYLDGTMDDGIPEEAKVNESLDALAAEQDRYEPTSQPSAGS